VLIPARLPTPVYGPMPNSVGGSVTLEGLRAIARVLALTAFDCPAPRRGD